MELSGDVMHFLLILLVLILGGNFILGIKNFFLHVNLKLIGINLVQNYLELKEKM
jgi:hypothetical protein